MLHRWMVLCFISLFGALLAPGAALAAAPAADPAIFAPIDNLVLAANAGSVTGARAAYVASPAIVDDFAPFRWSGPGAVAQWTRDLAAIVKQYGIVGGRFARHAPTYVHVAANRAWLVVPGDYTFKLKGKPQAQKVASAWTFVLNKAGGKWRIESSTWSTTSSTLE